MPNRDLMKFCCIPSPASKISNSPLRTRTMEDNARNAVGTAADVPKNTILSCTNLIECYSSKQDFIVIRQCIDA